MKRDYSIIVIEMQSKLNELYKVMNAKRQDGTAERLAVDIRLLSSELLESVLK